MDNDTRIKIYEQLVDTRRELEYAYSENESKMLEDPSIPEEALDLLAEEHEHVYNELTKRIDALAAKITF